MYNWEMDDWKINGDNDNNGGIILVTLSLSEDDVFLPCGNEVMIEFFSGD